MFKRTTKVTSLLVTAASVISMVPVMAADIKNVDAEDGYVYAAKANIGSCFIDAELNDEDRAVYYVNDGKYFKLDDAEPGDTMGDLCQDKYLQMTKSNGDDYYIDITTGKETDEYSKEIEDKEIAKKLRNKIKKDNDGRFAESEYTGKTVSKDNIPIYGSTGGNQFSYELEKPLIFGSYTKTKSSIYTNFDKDGTYFDGDYSLGKLGVVTTGAAITVDGQTVVLEESYITIKNTEDTYEVKDTYGNEYELKALIVNPNNEGENGSGYLSRSIDLSIWIKKKGDPDNSYTNITDKVEFGSSRNHHAVPVDDTDGGYGYYTRVMQKNSKEVASDTVNGIKYPKSTTLYFATDEDGVDESGTMLGYGDGHVMPVSNYWTPTPFDFKCQSINYKSKNGYNYLELGDVQIEKDITAWTIGCGDIYVLSDGYIKKFDYKQNKFIKLYRVDGAMNNIKAALEFNVVVWNEDKEEYSIIDLPLPWESAATTTNTITTSDAAVISTVATDNKGWIKAANGNWSYFKADGTKATGWQNVGGTWYYLNTSGIMQTGWINDEGTWYYCDASGAMLANTNVDGYVLGINGAWVK